MKSIQQGGMPDPIRNNQGRISHLFFQPNHGVLHTHLFAETALSIDSVCCFLSQIITFRVVHD